MPYKIDNPMTHVKVNNEIDFCEVKSEETRRKLEVALQKVRVSYFLRWQEPNWIQRLFKAKQTTIVFCINDAFLEKANEALESLKLDSSEYRLLGGKSKNKYYFEDKT